MSGCNIEVAIAFVIRKDMPSGELVLLEQQLIASFIPINVQLKCDSEHSVIASFGS